MEYPEESNTFFKLQLREFHPIGKLARLTLRFENADGTLYNFRGVNHDIIFAIHYYSAKKIKPLKQSIYNPEYNMDFLKYKYNTKDNDDYSGDSESDNEKYLKINLNNYKKKELLYINDKFSNGNEIDYEKIKKKLYENINNSENDDSNDDEINNE